MHADCADDRTGRKAVAVASCVSLPPVCLQEMVERLQGSAWYRLRLMEVWASDMQVGLWMGVMWGGVFEEMCAIVLWLSRLQGTGRLECG